ncbi:hypothetical protein PICSAR143_04285 [Mycobacterium avium subsp. paratuberculosis]|nr:hypothetical protein PICSAR143_04285 [Mycobacterium avium subsp. paratuberculosis]CAG7308023.1 hypothetical protein PICSAR52_04384 [Mycobacterium avium subsp. paratuberculosis]CAG7396267.1 hypothetical protein PICSAR7_04073 [Mycobacterium avium subsp. paratuberculosis]
MRHDAESARRGGDPGRPDRRRFRRATLAAGGGRHVDLLDRAEQGKAFGHHRFAVRRGPTAGAATDRGGRRRRRHQRGGPVLAEPRCAGGAARRRHPRPATRSRRRLHRCGLHRQRRHRLPAGHRPGRARRPDQPRAAGLGRVLRTVCRAVRRHRRPPPRAVRGRRADQPGAGGRRAGHRGQPGVAHRAASRRHPARTVGQRHLRPVRAGLHQPRRSQVHGCHVDRSAFSRPARRDGHRRGGVGARRCAGCRLRLRGRALPVPRRALRSVRHLVRRSHRRRNHRRAVAHHRALRAVPHLRRGRGGAESHCQSAVFPIAPTRPG